MYQAFSMDLRLARKRSGLSQRDVANLMAIDQSTYSAFERGRTAPNLEQVCALSLIFDRSFLSLFELMIEEVSPRLLERVSGVPRPKPKGPRLETRERHLHCLQRALAANSKRA
jgi:transcriptional regulator with XRE-family HTH domain